MSDQAVSKSAGKRPKKVPRDSLVVAEGFATTLWQGIGEGLVSRDALAGHLGLSAGSSTFDNRVALLRAFGLLDAEEDKLRLSSVGRSIIRTDRPDERDIARRKAFLTPSAYQTLASNFAAAPVPTEDGLAVTMRFEFMLDDAAALAAAKAFIESAAHAGVLAADRRVTSSVAPQSGSVQASPSELSSVPDERDASSLSDEIVLEEIVLDESHGQADSHLTGTVQPSVSLAVSIDLSDRSVEDVLRILNALGVVRDDK